MTPSFVAKSMERQQLRSMRKHTLQIVAINTALNELHQQIAPFIDKKKYEIASAYVNQYISYTHIWQIKFVCNLEEPEVALMQLFHLQHIFASEAPDRFVEERALLEQQHQKFRAVTLYSEAHIDMRHRKMQAFIQQSKQQ